MLNLLKLCWNYQVFRYDEIISKKFHSLKLLKAFKGPNFMLFRWHNTFGNSSLNRKKLRFLHHQIWIVQSFYIALEKDLVYFSNIRWMTILLYTSWCKYSVIFLFSFHFTYIFISFIFADWSCFRLSYYCMLTFIEKYNLDTFSIPNLKFCHILEAVHFFLLPKKIIRPLLLYFYNIRIYFAKNVSTW